MASNKSIIFKLQGTIEGVTFVNSKRYKPHTRRKRGTIKKVTLTGEMKENVQRLPSCNEKAKVLFHAIQDEIHDGGLWSRLLSICFAEVKAGRPIGVDCFLGLECNLPRKMDDVIRIDHDFLVVRNKKALDVKLVLPRHPKVKTKTPRSGYEFRFVAVFPDFEKGQFKKEVVISKVQDYTRKVEPVKVEIPTPSAKAPYLILLCQRAIMMNKSVPVITEGFLKVVAAG